MLSQIVLTLGYSRDFDSIYLFLENYRKEYEKVIMFVCK